MTDLTERPTDEARRDDEKDDERRVPVTLRQRAFPLLELMRGAVSSGSGVRWRKG